MLNLKKDKQYATNETSIQDTVKTDLDIQFLTNWSMQIYKILHYSPHLQDFTGLWNYLWQTTSNRKASCLWRNFWDKQQNLLLQKGCFSFVKKIKDDFSEVNSFLLTKGVQNPTWCGWAGLSGESESQVSQGTYWEIFTIYNVILVLAVNDKFPTTEVINLENTSNEIFQVFRLL